ncbi:MAG: DUF4340 domain-containing protein [Acetatifactor sp.]
MEKQRKQIVILLVILVVLAALLFGVKQYNKAQAEKPAETNKEVIIDVNSDDIIRYSYDYEGETYTFEKEGDTWYYAEDHSLKLLQYRTGSLPEGVAPLEATQVIEDVTDLSQYGLNEPQKTISYETATESYILYVGDRNSVTASYYVCMPSDATVYVIAATDINRFNVSLDDLIDTSEEESQEVSAEASSEASQAAEKTE